MQGPASPEDTRKAVDVILQRYDVNGDKRLSAEEVAKIIEEYEKGKDKLSPEVLQALRSYDKNTDGTLDTLEIQKMHDDIHATRYFAYAGMIARTARYLAFTSDLGEAFRPVVKPMFVTLSYGVSWAYVIGDVALESSRAHDRGLKGAELARFSSERAVFQVVASMAVPAFLIHSQVNVFKTITAKVGRFQRWGPTVAGLAVIPFLPLLLDEPAEKGVEWLFSKVWPTSSKHH